MIYVNQKQLDQVEYLIEQSCKGHHILFDNDVLRKAFSSKNFIEYKEQLDPKKISKKRATKLSDETDNTQEREAIEKHIENLILQPTLLAKKAYLENLHKDVYYEVVRTYFSIVENNIFETLEFSQ